MSHSFCVLICDRGDVCILIYKNRSTELRRCPRPPSSHFSFLAHCSHTICSSYLSVRGLASTERLFFLSFGRHSTTSILCIDFFFFSFLYSSVLVKQTNVGVKRKEKEKLNYNHSTTIYINIYIYIY